MKSIVERAQFSLDFELPIKLTFNKQFNSLNYKLHSLVFTLQISKSLLLLEESVVWYFIGIPQGSHLGPL